MNEQDRRFLLDVVALANGSRSTSEGATRRVVEKLAAAAMESLLREVEAVSVPADTSFKQDVLRSLSGGGEQSRITPSFLGVGNLVFNIANVARASFEADAEISSSNGIVSRGPVLKLGISGDVSPEEYVGAGAVQAWRALISMTKWGRPAPDKVQ